MYISAYQRELIKIWRELQWDEIKDKVRLSVKIILLYKCNHQQQPEQF